jgi:L-malate glycosyltransferase
MGLNGTSPPPRVITATQPHLVHVFPSFGVGGVPLRMARVINHLGARCRHTIVALDRSFDAASRLSSTLGVELLAPPLAKNAMVGNLFRIRGILRRLRPDLLLTYNWGAIEWALANRLMPISRHIHLEAGFGIEEASGQLARRVVMRRIALGGCMRIVVPSQVLRALALGEWRIAPERLLYLPNGIDVARFPPLHPLMPGPGAGADAIAIGTVAPLRPEKNVGRLIRAVGAIAPATKWRLMIVGDGSQRPELEALARSLNLLDRISFLGQMPNPEEFLRSFDVFALSSDTEQMPNAVLEAMAAGLPVVATDVGDIRRMVAPENAPYIVGRDTPGALAAALEAMAGDRAARVELGRLNRRRVEQEFSESGMLAAYERLLLQ